MDHIEPYRALLELMLHEARAGRFTIASSDLAVLETLVKPLREGDAVLEQLFRGLLDANEVSLFPATRSLGAYASRLRTEDWAEDVGRAPRGNCPAHRVHALCCPPWLSFAIWSRSTPLKMARAIFLIRARPFVGFWIGWFPRSKRADPAARCSEAGRCVLVARRVCISKDR